MLKELKINNFAIIDNLRVEFQSGFTALTGETGAGKSIIIDALTLILGGRADSDFIRTGETSATVECVFEITDPETLDILRELNINFDNGEILVRRTISDSGKNRCLVNDCSVTVGALSKIGNRLVDIHGQHDHQALLNPEIHVDILDLYGKTMVERNEFAKEYFIYLADLKKLDDLRSRESDRLQREDLLNFQINEINSAHIGINEESGLRENINRLSNAAELKQAATQAIQAFSGDENDNRWAVENLLREGGALLGQLQDMDPSTKPLNQLAEGTLFNIEDIVRRLRDYANSVEVTPEELELLEARMGLLNEMKRKYGNTLEEVVSYKDKLALQLEELDTSEQKIQDLREIQIEQKRLLGKTALALSVKRKKFSKPLETKVESYLKGVGMDNAKFKVRINNRKDEDGLLISACGNTDSYIYGPDGIDDVQMLFSTNKNHPPLPLSQVASGGELSRIMLAIFVTVNSSDTNSSLVFDEIDSGVGGRTGTIIGQKLRDLSNQRQVI